MNPKQLNKETNPSPRHAEPVHGPRMLILDDDPIVASIVRQHLWTKFSNAEIEVCHEAVAPPGYDVYFLDNDFNGKAMALHLLKSVRQVAPHALVVALSNTLDFAVMSDLVNAGCNAVYRKQDLAGSIEARRVIRAYLSILKAHRLRASKAGLGHLLSSMRALIESWNQRLAAAQTLPAVTPTDHAETAEVAQ